jgi:hypothetical protein
MKLASCDNCAHRVATSCSMGLAPPDGEFLCHRYAMTTTFRDEVVEAARQEYKRDIDQAMLHIAVARAERDQAFAG